jgi:hypothetical protein
VSSLALLCVFLFAMASPAEGLYWYNGAMVTTTGAIFAMFVMAAALHSQRPASGGAPVLWSGLAGLFGVAAAGSNEIVLYPLALGLATLGWLARRAQGPRWRLWLIPLTAVALAGVVDVLAPGNYKRAAVSGGLTRVLGPFIGSGVFTGMTVVEWLSNGPVLLVLIAAAGAGAVASSRIGDGSQWRRTSWLVAVLVGAAAIWGSFFFTHWASGFAFRPGPPARVINVMLLFFLLAGTVSAFMFGAQVLARYNTLVSHPTPVRQWFMLALAALLFGRGNIREAYVDLATGRAATYDRVLNERHAAMRAASGRQQPVIVPALTRIPLSIHFKDITADPEHPHNGCYARFWNVPNVKTRLEQPTNEH